MTMTFTAGYATTLTPHRSSPRTTFDFEPCVDFTTCEIDQIDAFRALTESDYELARITIASAPFLPHRMRELARNRLSFVTMCDAAVRHVATELDITVVKALSAEKPILDHEGRSHPERIRFMDFLLLGPPAAIDEALKAIRNRIKATRAKSRGTSHALPPHDERVSTWTNLRYAQCRFTPMESLDEILDLPRR